MHNIVIVGGNVAGVPTAHYLLRHVLPLLNPSSDKPSYKVTLITPNDHTFFKTGSPRTLVANSKEKLLAVFASIPDAFATYPPSQFTFIPGLAVGLDENKRIVDVMVGGGKDKQEVIYDSLVIATGTKSNSPLWTFHNSFSETRTAFEELNSRLATAKSILIGGGGAAGVETTGEIAYTYKSEKKDITILSGGKALLPILRNDTVSSQAETQLKALDVKVIHNLQVKSSTPSGDKTELLFSDGTKKTVDLYIDCTGGKPVTSFLPPSWLDSRSRVITDATTLRTPTPNVYSLGDVASFSQGGIPDSAWPAPALGYSIYTDLGGKGGLKEKKFKPLDKPMGVMPIGPKGGVGVMRGLRVPNWFVWLVKSRTYFLEKAPGLATGAEVLKP